MRHRTVLFWIPVLALFAGLVHAQPAPKAVPSSLADVIEEARKEGKLDVSWSEGVMGGSRGLAAMEKLINQKYGLNLKFNFTAGIDMSVMAPRMLQENKAGVPSSTDIYIGAGALYAPMVKADILTPVEWRKFFPHIPEKAVELGGRAVWVWSGERAIDYNTNLVSPAEIPKKMADVLNPKWKGRIASTPYAAGFDRWADMIGEEKVDAFMQVFTKEYVKGLIRGGGEVERVARGEFAMLVFDTAANDALVLKDAGAPINFVIPLDAAMLSPFYMMIPKNSAHPNAAKLFIATLQTIEGQEISWNLSRIGSHLVKGSKYAAWLEKEFQDIKNYKVFTAEYMIEHGDRLQKLLAKYRDMLMGGRK